ncbi:DUF1446 domain-containing protein [Exilibacterium tricleocarpae]|uniref:DUF1446 domain-containing protein n=1 Tax=Exilibacterium tricleocarpae TaxID=2591008 RepID=A0A545ST51_9GAMM|nr:acyclic terpene utilization AtuA family protein [Exilibacterium tricleocarpae]TQV68148.1 DUF1446 domain-containing protein [Exilibacterium tricleocarpae]
MSELKVLTPTGMMGYGFPEEDLLKALDHNPDVMVVDSGSIDSGPQKLGSGSMTTPEDAYRAEFKILLKVVNDKKIPLYISSAGGAGSNQQVDSFRKMVEEICQQEGYQLSIACIYADISKEHVREMLAAGKVKPCGKSVPELTEDELDCTKNIVGQMGIEPFMRAIERDTHVIIAGRAYDPAPIAAIGIYKGFDPALCWHMGKILECGGLCAEPACQVMLGTLREDHFELEPLSEDSCCTEISVAAHTLYEKSHPYLLPGPGGTLDLSGCRFEQIDNRRVKVSGSQFVRTPYTVKLEGVKMTGYRTTTIAGVRDPNVIAALDEIETMARYFVLQNYPQYENRFKMRFQVYGRDGVLGALEPDLTPAKEVCVVIEVLGETQDIATHICAKARVALLHAPYAGRIATSGNCGFMLTPLEIPLGETYEFSIYHLMDVSDPCVHFPVKYFNVG